MNFPQNPQNLFSAEKLVFDIKPSQRALKISVKKWSLEKNNSDSERGEHGLSPHGVMSIFDFLTKQNV